MPGCRLALAAAKIAASVERSVPPYAAKVEKTGDLALGIAETKTQGVGLRVDPLTLDVSPVFEEDGKDAVRGVVPLARSGSLTFFVDRDDHALHSAHTIDEVPPFTLGVSDAGFSRVVAGSTSLIWQLDPSTKITEPRSAQLADYGYGVTFRRGGQSGAVMLGFVANDGEKKSELAEVPGAPKFLGTPVIAGSNSGALIAFAGRDTPGAAMEAIRVADQARRGARPGTRAHRRQRWRGDFAGARRAAWRPLARAMDRGKLGAVSRARAKLRRGPERDRPKHCGVAERRQRRTGRAADFRGRRGHAVHPDHGWPRRTLGSNAGMCRTMISKTRSRLAPRAVGDWARKREPERLRAVRLE